jgi:hypothetical protein
MMGMVCICDHSTSQLITTYIVILMNILVCQQVEICHIRTFWPLFYYIDTIIGMSSLVYPDERIALWTSLWYIDVRLLLAHFCNKLK